MDNEIKCGKDAVYRYTWPGQNENFICQEHSEFLERVADAMGLPLQLIPMLPAFTTLRSCSQIIRK